MIPQRTQPDGAAKDSKGILRGLPAKAPPFSPPPGVEDQVRRLKRLFGTAAFGAAAILLCAIFAFFYFRKTETSAADYEPKAGGKEVKFTPGKLGVKKPLGTLPDSLKSSAVTDVKGKDAYLEAIGALTIVHLYQTYLNIGLLADAVENETYTFTEAVNVMLTVTELLGLVEKQLAKAPLVGGSPEDTAALESIKQLTALLRTQSTSLVSYWASRDEAHAARYQAVREQSWNAIRDMMGLEE